MMEFEEFEKEDYVDNLCDFKKGQLFKFVKDNDIVSTDALCMKINIYDQQNNCFDGLVSLSTGEAYLLKKDNRVNSVYNALAFRYKIKNNKTVEITREVK